MHCLSSIVLVPCFCSLSQGIQGGGMFWSPLLLILKCSARVSQRSRDALVVPWACELLGGGTGQVPGAVCACTRYRTLPLYEPSHSPSLSSLS